jgi:hypothetical protein
MPFTKTTAPLPTSASVTVKFFGLMFIRPSNDSSFCDIAVLHSSSAPNHKLEIELMVEDPAAPQPPNPILLHAGPITGKPFTIRVDPQTHAGVFAYKPTPPPFFRDNPGNNELDFQWTIDINELHPDGLSVKDAEVHPGITMTDGIFYSLKTTEETTVKIILIRGMQKIDLHRIAGSIAAVIPFTGRNQAVLEWCENGLAKTLNLPRSGDPPNTSYSVLVRNLPPPKTPFHDELASYYNALTRFDGNPIPPELRYTLPISGETSDEIPCMPVGGP